VSVVVAVVGGARPPTDWRGDTQSFSFRARVRGVELEAINLVRFNEQGQIVEFKVFVRPLAGLATLFAALPPRVRRGVATRSSGASSGEATRE
jgi:hypothetical protein